MSTSLRAFACLALLVSLATAARAQTRPPILFIATPYGMQRGTTATFVVEGANIAGTDRVLFTHEGLTATIDGYEEVGPDIRERKPGETGAIIQDKAMKAKLRITVTARADVPTGRHGFRLTTPLGTSSFWPIWIGDEPEISESEPNDDGESARLLETPVTVNGKLGEEGDVDQFRVRARAGQDLVVSVTATGIASQVDTLVSVHAPGGDELASNDDFKSSRDSLLIYRPKADGDVLVRVTDANAAGSWRHHYRVTIGAVPVVTSVFPLGRRAGSTRPVRVAGANLPAARLGKPGPVTTESASMAPVLVQGLSRGPLNRVNLALGRHPEIAEREQNGTLATAQRLTLPVTVNGRIGEGTARAADRDLFRVALKKGQTVVVQVAAQRLGSPLDSLVEVLDARGTPVPRARLRAVWETTVDLRSRGSTDTGLRLLAWDELRPGDYVYVDRELLRVDELPKGPDEDVSFVSYRGRRIGFEETTPEGHALLRPVYKVEVHPPGAELPPNGFPMFDLTYRNDDGGSMLGRDSRLTFTAPASGTYFIRLSDTRKTGSRLHAYRLTVAPPQPDFELFVSPSNPNVPRGGRVPVTVFVSRTDGFAGAVDVGFRDLPAGLTATAGRILPGDSSVVLTLSAAVDAGDVLAPLKVTGRAEIDGAPVERDARPDERVSMISVAAPPDVRVVSVTPDVLELRPGGRATVTATIERANGFAGRVPLSVRNLPFRTTVPDIGLNGILITEEQTSRTFEIVAGEHVEPTEQTLYVTARVETNGGTSEHSSIPIKLRIVPSPADGARTAKRD